MRRLAELLLVILFISGCQYEKDFSEESKSSIEKEIRNMHYQAKIRMNKNIKMPPSFDKSLRNPAKTKQKDKKLYNISANNVPAKKFFYTLSKQTNTNMVVDEEVKGNITFDLMQVTLDSIMDLLSSVHNVYFKRIDGTIYVTPRRLETKIYTIQGLALKRKGSSSMQVAGGNESSGSASTSNSTLETTFDIENIWQDISTTISAIIESDYRTQSTPQHERDISYV